MGTRIDEMVLQVQQWLNQTYGLYVASGRFNLVTENGRTGWNTIYGLRRALQIELGIIETSDSFGPTTYKLCPAINQGSEGNLVSIVQGGLWCKGYGPGGFNGYYGNGTYAAVKALKTDAGFPSASGNMQRDFMRALLDMSAFTCVSGGTEEIRVIQQQLNYDYYDYYQISPCDGLYNREMNKMLIYALQMELGISSSAATGTWGPTTISLCKEKSFTIGNTNAIIKLIKYALVCNGFTVSTNSTTYDATLELATNAFCNSLLIQKSANIINYGVIKSLLSSNGDTDRVAKGCDTATKLNIQQIQTIKDSGYEIVGRYLTNTANGTLDKCLTELEITNIFNGGLKIFPIFQETGRTVNNFSFDTGKENGQKAFDAAEKFSIPHGTTVYFAVDFDPTDTEITSGIIPYFSAICTSSLGRKYRVGVYGTRNVCNRLNNELGIKKFFVLGASYGFSGNLGFTMPEKWCFDQFTTDIVIGSGNGQVAIDKVAVSNRDTGFKQTNSYIKNKVLDFTKGFGIDDKVNISADFETDMLQILEQSPNGNYISLRLVHGVTNNPEAGISFNNEGELSTSINQYLNDPVFAGVTSDTKTSIVAAVNQIGFSVEKGNLKVSIMTVSDQYNSGVIIAYELTFPINSDETVYAKASLLFKYKGDVYIDLSTLEIPPEQAAMFSVLVIGIGCCAIAPALIPALGSGFGLSEAITGVSGIISGIFKYIFG